MKLLPQFPVALPVAFRRISRGVALSTAINAGAAIGVLLAVLAQTAPRAAAAPAAAPAAPAAAPAPSAPASAAPADIASAVQWMPQGAQLVLRVRFADMRTSALFRSLMASKPLFAAELAPVERFAAEAGINLGRDLDLGWIGTDGRETGPSVAVLSGRLDGTELGARLVKRGAQTATYADRPLYTLARRGANGAGGGETVVAFPRAGTALVGTRSWVSVVLDRMQGRNGAATPLLPLAGRADSVATIWSAAAGSAVSEKIRSEWASGQLGGEDFQGIQHLVATVRIAGDVSVDSEATAPAEDADMLTLTLKGLMAVSGLRASVTDPSLAEVLKETRIERTSGGVRLRTRLPASFVSRL